MILPTYTITGTGGTVDLSRKHGPEELQLPTETTGTEIRRCMAEDDDTPGAVYLLVDPYGLPGQTLTTSHRVLTDEQHALLAAWCRSKEVVTVVLDRPGEDTLNTPAVITRYVPRPRNRRFGWSKQVTAELEITFVEED